MPKQGKRNPKEDKDKCDSSIVLLQNIYRDQFLKIDVAKNDHFKYSVKPQLFFSIYVLPMSKIFLYGLEAWWISSLSQSRRTTISIVSMGFTLNQKNICLLEDN